MAKRRHASAFSFFRRGPASTSRKPWELWVVVGVIAVLGVMVARSVWHHDQLTQWRHDLERQANGFSWPPWSADWPPLPKPRHDSADLSGPYAFVATHSQQLRKIPCFCGCERLGHRSNADCYLRLLDDKGRPAWDPHSFSCSMCVRITREVALMLHQGKQLPDIRHEIEVHYREQYGNGTNTSPANEK